MTYLTLFSNSILAINDYALSNGFNAEQIKEKRDSVTRNQKILISEVKNFLKQGQNNIDDFIKNRGKELYLRADRIQNVLNTYRNK